MRRTIIKSARFFGGGRNKKINKFKDYLKMKEIKEELQRDLRKVTQEQKNQNFGPIAVEDTKEFEKMGEEDEDSIQSNPELRIEEYVVKNELGLEYDSLNDLQFVENENFDLQKVETSLPQISTKEAFQRLDLLKKGRSHQLEEWRKEASLLNSNENKKDLQISESEADNELMKKIDIKEETERISKYLSRSSICSRRQAERLISKGLVQVDGKRIDSNIAINQYKNKISIYTKKGWIYPVPKETKLWLFYKPRGLICTHKDPMKRPTIFQFIKDLGFDEKEHIISVGRLDYNSEGLMLLTNDGELSRALEHPSNKLSRVN